MTAPIDLIVSRLENRGNRPKKADKGWKARCPAHDDKNPSLSIDQGEDGRVLLHCHAGCKTEAVLEALGLSMRDLSPSGNGKATNGAKRNGKREPEAVYPYHADDGRLLFQVCRFAPKRFRQRRPKDGGGWEWSVKGVPPVPYRLPELLSADPREPVFIVEGEKDADRLAALGMVVTTNAGGAGKWRPEFAESLRGRRVVALPDNDEPGREHAQAVAASLQGAAASVRIVELPGLPEKGDVSNWLDAGGTPERLRELAAAAPEWQAPAAGRPGWVCMADVRSEPVQWLWPGRVALGKLTFIQGNPEVGKSFLTLDMAARVSTGRPWPDCADVANAAGAVLLLSAEDGRADTILPRLQAAGADSTRVFAPDRVSSLQGPGLGELERAIQERGPVRLVVIDPIAAYLGNTDSHKNADVRRFLAPLADLAERNRVAVVCVTHLNKNGEGPAMYRATGSLAFVAAARAVWLATMDKGQKDRRLLLSVKNNLTSPVPGLAYRIVESAIPGVGKVEWEPDPVTTSADEALSIPWGDDGRPNALQEAKDWLTDLLTGGPIPGKQVKARAERDGIALRTLDRAKVALEVRAYRKGFKRGSKWLWELPARSAPTDPVLRQAPGVAQNGELGAEREETGGDDAGKRVGQ